MLGHIMVVTMHGRVKILSRTMRMSVLCNLFKDIHERYARRDRMWWGWHGNREEQCNHHEARNAPSPSVRRHRFCSS